MICCGGDGGTDDETVEGMLVAGDTEGAKSMNKWTEMMLKMTALKPQDDLRVEGMITTTETGLLCALLGNNVIQAQKCFLVGLWLHTQ